MKELKGFYKKDTTVHSLKHSFREVTKYRIDILNKIYKKEKLPIQIDKNLYTLKENDYKTVSNFFIFPTHKIYKYSKQKEEHIGFRISLLKRTDITKIKKISFNIKLGDLKNAEELYTLIHGKEYKFNGSKANLKKIIEASLKMSVYPRIVYTDTIGWIQGNEELHYVPITDYEDDNILCSAQLKKDYNITNNYALNENELFAEIIKLLNITDKKVTIPLLAFTALSSFNSLIHKNNTSCPEFLLCLHNKNESPLKTAIANLFCNVFNRSQHIYSIDSRTHNNQWTNSEMLEKISSISDAPCITQISGVSKLGAYIKPMKQYSNGIIILSSNPLKHDSVINLGIDDSEIDQKILKHHKENPIIFSSWFTSFILYIQSEFGDKQWGLDNRGLIDQFYKDCTSTISEDKADYDINKLRHYAWLLVGYSYFLNYGLKNDAINAEQFTNMANEAIVIFRELSKIEVPMPHENQNTITESPLHRDALNFLHMIDQILTVSELVNYEEKNNYSTTNISYGFIDKTTLYIHSASTSNIYEKVSSLLKDAGKKLSHKNTAIYEHLYNEGLLTLDDKDTPEKIKGNSYAKTVALKNKGSIRMLHLNISAVRKYLLSNGFSLHFFQEK
ncbi:hypothetical protein IEE_03932 [Bacillus cereus BAG5X1-1]|uniref:Uncharacterized protein n=1 Tax=Bacillus cereus BAG5X1-1 TaxID=1053189 RepID=J8AGY1_BACCE|nr:hypothetical protein [Bacillus cereus]EJQ42367.1 hypothetical protein IEE_03932 [Bacillus cereus BAG5X1-1]